MDTRHNSETTHSNPMSLLLTQYGSPLATNGSRYKWKIKSFFKKILLCRSPETKKEAYVANDRQKAVQTDAMDVELLKNKEVLPVNIKMYESEKIDLSDFFKADEFMAAVRFFP
ncbi:hypothetical protein RF11_09925 [Thelohanellus kitauei]|uniref:Uncharacterized protein n=1 Tax=Thelohanellus kitauei TaxID=669202 RepID=A0A0C2N9T3_THEKT|nr:hypothetical protein RF11_09925 [Thelohanellus kitauei]